MVFGFLKGLNSPEAGHRAIRASYEKHYRLARTRGIEPISMGLFGALGSRYKLRGRFVSDTVHMIEVAPFMMMGEAMRVERLANYLMADEIPDQIDIQAVRSGINNAVCISASDSDAFELLASAAPHLSELPIRWVAWLSEPNRTRLREASSQ